MFGKTEFFSYAVLLISICAVLTDLIYGKIYNWLTLPAVVIGFLTSCYWMGLPGAGQALLGCLAGLLFYGWMFRLGFMGGGDVKLLMALGAWGGFRFTEQVAILAILVGGVLAIGILIFKGRIRRFVQKIYHFLISIYVKELELQPLKIDKSLTMPFGIPISIAATWIAFANPFEKWGVLLWPF